MVHIRFVKKIYKNNQPVLNGSELEMVKRNLTNELLSLPSVHEVIVSVIPNTNKLVVEYYRNEETFYEKTILAGKQIYNYLVSLFK